MNGKQGLTWGTVGGLVFGITTALAAAYTVRQSEIEFYMGEAQKSARIEQIVTENQAELAAIAAKLDILDSRQRWVIQVIVKQSGADHLALPPIP